MRKMSLVAASLLLASNFAAANSLEDAIKGGTVSGDVTLYGERVNNSGHNSDGDSIKDSGYTMGSIGLSYETADFNGFKAAVGFRGNHDFSEVEDEDYVASEDESTAIMHTANISYVNEYFGLTFGRQEIDLEWMGDYHEAVVLGVTAIPDTTITAGYSERIAVADEDAALEKYDDLGNGAFVLDVKYEGVDNLVLNPYFYDVDMDIKDEDTNKYYDADASWYGLKADFDTDMFGITLHGAKSSEDAKGVDDGQILHAEGRLNVAGFGFAAGYIKADSDGGIGSMAAAGDNINPFDAIAGGDGNQVYSTDAKTAYIAATYELAGVGLTAMYGQTKYDMDDDNENVKEKEFDLAAEYGITDNLSAGVLYANVSSDESTEDYEDYDKFTLTLQYSF